MYIIREHNSFILNVRFVYEVIETEQIDFNLLPCSSHGYYSPVNVSSTGIRDTLWFSAQFN
jgi:hypothetical protein